MVGISCLDEESRAVKSLLKAIGEYLFGVLFFMGAFVTIVGAGVIDFGSADRSVQLFYGVGVAAFGISLCVLLGAYLLEEPDDSE